MLCREVLELIRGVHHRIAQVGHKGMCVRCAVHACPHTQCIAEYVVLNIVRRVMRYVRDAYVTYEPCGAHVLASRV